MSLNGNTYWCNGRCARALYKDQYWASKANEGTTTRVHYTQIDRLYSVIICTGLTSRRATVLRKRSQAKVASIATMPRALVRTHKEPILRSNSHSLHRYREKLLSVAPNSNGTNFAAVTLGHGDGTLESWNSRRTRMAETHLSSR